jgi:hypothetical protein
LFGDVAAHVAPTRVTQNPHRPEHQ